MEEGSAHEGENSPLIQILTNEREGEERGWKARRKKAKRGREVMQ